MSIGIDEVQEIIDELEAVTTKRIKAEARLEQEMEALETMGYGSIEEATKALKKLGAKIDKRSGELEESFTEFKEDFEELFA